MIALLYQKQNDFNVCYYRYIVILFWIILVLIFLVGLLAYREYRNPDRDIHEGNLVSIQMSVWSIWLAGVLMFGLGYTLDKPWIGSNDGDSGFSPLWIICATFGLIIFYFACVSSLPMVKRKPSKKDKD